MMAVARKGRAGRSGSASVHAGHVLSTIAFSCPSCMHCSHACGHKHGSYDHGVTPDGTCYTTWCTVALADGPRSAEIMQGSLDRVH